MGFWGCVLLESWSISISLLFVWSQYGRWKWWLFPQMIEADYTERILLLRSIKPMFWSIWMFLFVLRRWCLFYTIKRWGLVQLVDESNSYSEPLVCFEMVCSNFWRQQFRVSDTLFDSVFSAVRCRHELQLRFWYSHLLLMWKMHSDAAALSCYPKSRNNLLHQRCMAAEDSEVVCSRQETIKRRDTKYRDYNLILWQIPFVPQKLEL